ncbi:CLUMA_CG011978, isoform A [Clunio marinus]|uniref:CLUMA_CG011978, isoform A n=1 Tax=Clunio marinus TaxID=568069 RepID=A0A1J1IKC6_9DIPT|nr:CLUMA_CG011978, isoform A [Clunio marinus]
MYHLIINFCYILLSINVLYASPISNEIGNEFVLTKDVKMKNRWVLIPDTNGRMHLVDMKAYKPNHESQPVFNVKRDVKFILSTQRVQGVEIKMNLTSLLNARFGKNHPTRFLIHGWNGDMTSAVNERVTREYLKRGQFNVISVDWSKGAGTLDYIAASYRVYEVANFTAKFIDFLVEHGYIRFNNIHVIGHSLGGHTAGLVGKYVKGGKIRAIFGLDPAGPLFDLNNPEERIAADDGEYVEVLHTNGGFLGIGSPIGQADFFPNFGRWQPGCGIDLTGTCSHSRAPEFFAESINSNAFIATRCASFKEIKNERCTTEWLNERIMMNPEAINTNLKGGINLIKIRENFSVFHLKMNKFGALIILVLASAVTSSPLLRDETDDISPLREFKEEVNVDDPKHRWAMIPDGDGRMHLIDLNIYPVDIEPSWNADQDVFFLLYTRRNPTSGERITFNADAIRNTNFNSGAPVRFVIHGWNNDHTSAVNTQITSAYLQNGEFNVIVVDWGAGANTIDYVSARNRINSVADVVARLIDFLVNNGLTQTTRVYVVGHSLGGHTAGLTGKRVTRGRLPYIMGLDPAGPLFSTGNVNERIDAGDANQVEIMHTNGWTLGFGEPLGRADFFPNGGRSQPGCGIDLTGSCAHGRAPTYFAESLNSAAGFVANRCATFAEVDRNQCTIQSSGHRMGGEPPNLTHNGFFLLATNSNAPFARG